MMTAGLDGPRLSYGVLGVGVVSVAVFLTAPADSAWQMGAWFVPLLLAAGLLGARVTVSPASARGPLWLLLAGQLGYLALSLVWYLGPVGFGYELPFPSPLDAGHFTVYAIYAVFLVVVLRRRAGDRAVESRIALTDSLILTTALSAVLWVAVIHPNLSNGTPALSTAVAVLYPGVTLVLFALAARLAVSGGFARTVPGALLLVWVGAEVAGDVFYGFQSVNGTFVHAGPLTATWMVSYTALGALAAHPGVVDLLSPAAPGSARGRTGHGPIGGACKVHLTALLVAALVPLALAGVQDERCPGLLAAAAVTFALVSYRTALLTGDLTEQRRLTAQLDQAVAELSAQRDELARSAAILAATDDSVITTCRQGVVVDWNPGAERLYGYSPSEMLGQHITMLIAPTHQHVYASTMATVAEFGHARIESLDVRKDGSTVPTSVVISTIYDATGTVTGLVGIARDISQRKRAEEQARVAARELELQARELERLAFRDPVTGLGNRALLRQRASAVGMRLDGTALLLLDLDGFKEVNDSLGHAAGDRLLLEVGDRLGSCVRTADTVVRLGGDEFALLLPDTAQHAAALTAQRVLAQLRAPFVLGSTVVQLAGSIGITLGTAGSDLDELLRNADLAMYEAKSAGRDQAVAFDPAMHERAARRLQVDTDLRAALTRGEFTVYYQPIVDAASGEVACLEALIRWDHPQRGVVPPFEFLPAAERSGLIVELGRFVLHTACEQVAQWRQDWPNLTVAVNVSHRELLDPGFATTVEAVLTSTGLPAHALHLEITETVLAAEEDITLALESLAARGVALAIDDFGTGHSSLSRLRDLPAQRLKIDKSFVGEVSDDGTAVLLSSIIALAHALGRTVVAEGVETAEQCEFLIEHGCDELQGYLFSRPVAAAHVVPVLFSTRTRTRTPRTDHVRREQGTFPRLVETLLDSTRPLASVLPALLAELTAISGLQTAFVTELPHGLSEQVTRFAHNSHPDVMHVEEGLTLDWERTLCRRMIEDKVLCETQVASRYPDVAVATTLGIGTYVSIPVQDTTGAVRGTLCAASSDSTAVRPAVIELMQLFAHSLAERIATEPNAPTAAAGQAAASYVVPTAS